MALFKRHIQSVFFVASIFSSCASQAESFALKLVAAAKERTLQQVTYSGAYYAIDYPLGDVPNNLGVCTDLVVRSYRKLNVDLQQLVHEDMAAAFDAYPSKRIWGLNKPDSNIDHRRVPNLQTFFRRHGESLVLNQDAQEFKPGDLVTWMLPGNLPHIGIVSDEFAKNKKTPLIIHNIGSGPEQSDMLFTYAITGHYRFYK